jgi:polar amino acid transport system substrate-binding protein
MLVRRSVAVSLTAMLLLAACGSGEVTPSASTPGSPTAVAPTGEPATASPGETEPTETTAPSPTAEIPAVSEECQAPAVESRLKNAPRLTLSTDIPAFPPWWGGDPEVQYPNEPEGGSGWEVSDPYSMEGYESAVAYAVAGALGFAPEQVDWIQNAVFAQAFRPGPKDFDYHLAQISIRERRARNVDFSESYFDANQSVLALAGNEIISATSIDALKDFRLGAAVGTTSLELIETVIQPTQEPSVYDDNAAALVALEADQIDGLVVDLQTAFFMRDAQIEDFDTPEPEGIIVGQFDESAQVDQMGIVLEKDSPLTECVNQALAMLHADGTIDAIYDEWISSEEAIPYFE